MAVHWGGRGPGHMSRSIGVDAAVIRLRALAQNGAQPTAMGSPPTATLGAAGAATTVPSTTTTYTWTDAARFNLTNGPWAVAGGVYPANQAGKNTTTNYTIGSSTEGFVAAIEFKFTGRYLEPQFIGRLTDTRMLVADSLAGPWQSVDLPAMPNDGSLRRVLIDFGATVTDKFIRIEQMGLSRLEFIQMIVQSTATVTATTTYGGPLVIVGDSFTEGTGAIGTNPHQYMLAYKIGRELGIPNVCHSGSGGTGWVQINGARINLGDRWAVDVTGRAPTMVICLMGLNDVNDGNDAAIQTLIGTKLDDLRAAYPECLVHMFGPFDTSAPGAPIAGFTGMQSAIQNASTGKVRTWFHSLEGISFTKADATHPDNAGHTTLFKAIYNKIAAVHGLHTVA